MEWKDGLLNGQGTVTYPDGINIFNYYFKACFWKFCSWKSDRPRFPLQSVLREIDKKQEEIDKKHREAQRKKSLIDNEKALKELNELRRLNDIAYLFSRYY